MKISIENFKSISKVHNFEIKPMTVLSGTNSSGKSSFVQMLLLIKKTLEDSSTKSVLSIKNREFKDIVFNQNKNNKILFSIVLDPKEVTIPPNYINTKEVSVDVGFQMRDERIFVSDFILDLKAEEGNSWFLKINNETERASKAEVSNPSTFIQALDKTEFRGSIDFAAMIPQTLTDTTGDKYPFKIDWIKDGLTNVFNSFYYIGPIRQKPEIAYKESLSSRYVGIAGEYTAQILKDFENEKVDSYSFNQIDKKSTTLLEAVNYWLCDQFKISKKVYSEKKEDSYQIYLEDNNGLKVNIKHVGYGVSQVLPIVVQGLLMPKEGILIIEQPEIHLHPKIQSLLYDFFYSLTLIDKKVIVETHSSHFITRMRRRIAEDESNNMDDIINLTFIENGIFRKLELDDFGTILNYYPEDFIEQPAKEMDSIIKAQIKKRRKNG
ncbi:AAA family ATPase [Zunongwangia sp. F260]|uniref:AAA family ATPase n=1 Tax=Autumnicola lenta TaxID=3075593 RepID=A0ABU3CKS5_9FLAO|nr:AAA family ATPase [Zunongwangia sp. F260]MDT0646952.1 AAA family ATPase [Zunongwangia sp. F260]